MSSVREAIISKTIFLECLHCSKNTWLKLHRPDLHKHFQLSEFEKHLLEQGNEVDSIARNLFPGGVEVVGTGEEACQETVRLMTAKAPALFQATFIVDGFIARNDALVYDEQNNHWDLYEVKGTNSLKENTKDHDHIDDLAFQDSVLRRANIPIGKYFLVHLNKDYVRQGEIDVQQLLLVEEQTEKVKDRLKETEERMAIVKEYLLRDTEPVGECSCVYEGRSNHCTTFQYSNPEVPEYSVHDISRIGNSKKKLKSLIDRKIYDLAMIPEDMDLSDIQWNQVRAHQQGKVAVDLPSIGEILNQLSFPLYFLDYETFAPAIPIFDGYKPYQRIPFQLSLHILETLTDTLQHVEYLHPDRTDPTQAVAQLLQQHIKSGGTVITWNKSFEAGVNGEMGQRLPAFHEFMQSVNSRLFDLREIFQKQHYVHPKFYGSTSIKKVLPALLPDLKYEALGIQEGGQASDAWWKMVSPETAPEDSKIIASDLKEYCGFDTYAMYIVWKELSQLVST